MTKQTPVTSNNSNPRSGSLSVLVGLLSLTGVILCLALVGLALFRAGYLPAISSLMQSTATPVTANEDLNCQNLIHQAILVSGNNCDHIGANKVCYGNNTIQADLIPDANKPFTNIGDVVDIQQLQSLSTAPLNLQKNEWGIAIFNIIANLPRSLPGEVVKMVVFGNTTIGNNDITDVQSYFFSSELGQIVCNKIPFDGIMITMLDGTGVRLMINGSDLVLMGNASLRAAKNETMDVTLYSGTASITANNQTQYFVAGQKVQVPLGGANGTDAIGVPSVPTTFSNQEAVLACSLLSTFCSSATSIPTVNAQNAQATFNSVVNTTPFSTIIATNIAGPLVTFVPAATIAPPDDEIQPTPRPEKPEKTPPGQIKTPRPEPTHKDNDDDNGKNDQAQGTPQK